MTLISLAVNALLPISAVEEFHNPSIMDFFPDGVFFVGTPFEMNRIILIRLIVMVLIVLLFWLGTRNLKPIPGRFQSVIEAPLNFVRVQIAEDQLGKVNGKRFLPLITAIFVTVLAMNLTGVIPFANIAATSTIAFPLVLALFAYAAFLYAGIKQNGVKFFTTALFPPGVPPVLYIILTPIEFFSTFILRPITLALRLVMNMMVGHMLLVLFFAATHFFLFSAEGLLKGFSVATLAMGLAFTLFEMGIAFLQAYIFALLTAVYIQLSLEESH